jgi:hypothetical protein
MLDPGSMGGTGLFRNMSGAAQTTVALAFRFPTILNWLDPGLQVSLKEDSAATLLKLIEDPRWAAADPMGPILAVGGAPYYAPNGKPAETYGEANDPVKAAELWADSAKLLGLDRSTALAA